MLKFSNFFKVVGKVDKVFKFGAYEYTEHIVQVGDCEIRALIDKRSTCEVGEIYMTYQMYLTGGYPVEEGIRYDKAVVRIEKFVPVSEKNMDKAKNSFKLQPFMKCVGNFCPPADCKIVQLPPSYDPAFIFTTSLFNERFEKFPIKCIVFGNKAKKIANIERNTKVRLMMRYSENKGVGEYNVVKLVIPEVNKYNDMEDDGFDIAVC